MYQAVSLQDLHFNEKCLELYQQDGFCVIQDVFTQEECNQWIESILLFFTQLGTGIDLNNVKETWITNNLPQTRTGLFQSIVSNMQTVWNIRSHPNIQKIFEMIYSNLHEKEIKDFIVSNDGINICPNGFGRNDGKDWAHIDQTIKNKICVQGQAVLSNTTACFRASPGSHKMYDEIMKLENVYENDSNWHKIQNCSEARKLIEAIDGKWQIPILAPSGSFIIWSSKTIHSARLAIREENPTLDDKWLGWRAIVYVCYRPREEFTAEELKKRASVIADNRVTNHWSTKIFPKNPRSSYRPKYHENIEKLVKDPRLVYRFSPLTLNEIQKRLAGLK